MGRTTLHLLGTFALATPDGPVRVGRKAQAMLACAALQRAEGVTRPRLMALLWPELAEEDARTALRQCLHLLRRALGPSAESLDSAGDRLVLHEQAWDIDLLRFQSLATREDLSSMLEAANIYRGDLLESLDVGDEFGRWVMAERERLRGLAQALLTRLAASVNSPEGRETTVALARRLLAGDPVHEGCYRALMRVHARAGLLAKAQAIWNECRDVLRRELGVEPSLHTAALMAELRGEAHPARASPPAADDAVIDDMMLRGYQLWMLATAQDNARARDTFQAAADRAPGHAKAIAMVAFTHWLDSISGWTDDPTRSWKMAEEGAARALACDPDEATVHTLYGKLHLWSFRYDAALADMDRALALAPEDAWVHFHRGDACSWCGMCDEALASIERAMAKVANDAGVFLTIRAWAHWIQRDYRLARVAATSASTRNPAYAWPHGILACIHAECGDIDAARKEAGLACALNPRLSLEFARHVGPMRHPEHRRRWVEAWRAAGMPEHEQPGGWRAATQTATQAPVVKTRSNDDPRVLDLLLQGRQHFLLFTPENNARARAAYEAALDIAPDHAEAIARLAWTYWADSVAGWCTDPALSMGYAANCASRACASEWEVTTAHTVQGKVLLWRQQHDAALRHLRRAIALVPNDAFAHFNFGDAAAWSGLCDESLASIDRAMALDPDEHGVFLTIRGFALALMRSYGPAGAALESAIARNPAYPWSHGILAVVRAECGDVDAARSAAADAQRLSRRISIEYAQHVLPFREPEHRKRWMQAWRTAGMPEHERPGGVPMTPPHRVALGG